MMVLLPIYLAIATATVLLLTKLGVSLWVSIPIVLAISIGIIYMLIAVKKRKSGKK